MRSALHLTAKIGCICPETQVRTRSLVMIADSKHSDATSKGRCANLPKSADRLFLTETLYGESQRAAKELFNPTAPPATFAPALSTTRETGHAPGMAASAGAGVQIADTTTTTGDKQTKVDTRTMGFVLQGQQISRSSLEKFLSVVCCLRSKSFTCALKLPS
jgi:hypothetical protein